MLKKIVLTTALLSSVSAHAELLSMSFTDTNGEVVSKAATTPAINPSSTISFTLSGGIGRSVGVEFVKGNTVYTSGQSGMITVKDELTHEGKNFYGHTISVPKPIDGSYTVKAYIYDINNNVINVDAYSMDVDTVAPTTAGTLNYLQSHSSSYNNYDISTNIRDFTLRNNSDDFGNIVSAKLVGKKSSDSTFIYTDATLESNGDVSILKYPSAILKTDGIYELGFALYDLAGNKNVITKEYRLDNSYPETSFSHVLNANTGLWDIYTPGMTVQSNPATFRVRVPKTSHRDFSASGTGIANGYKSVDDNYVYYHLNVMRPAVYSYIRLFTEAGIYRNYQQHMVDYQLANGVDEGPEKNGEVDYMTSDMVWFDSNTTRFSVPSTVTKVRVNVKARSYEQLAIFNGDQCIIPAGDQFCDVDTILTRDTESGYGGVPVFLQSSVNGVYDSRFHVHIGYLLVHWDFVPPIIDELITSVKTVTMNVTDTSKPLAWTNSKWNTYLYSLRATNVTTGAIIDVKHSSYKATSYNTYTATVDLTVLPEGRYSIIAIAEDTYGNKGTKNYSDNFIVDNTPPIATLTYEDGLFPNTIDGLENINLALSDPSTAKVDSIQLTGGPTNTIVNLAWRSSGVNEYGLEYPKLFPSLIQGEAYTLTIYYSDAFNNAGNISVQFEFIPANLVNIGVMNTLAVNKNLLTQTNVPFAIIESPALLNDNGELARGEQILDITLRTDAEFAVIIQGVRLEPGETKIFTIDVSTTGGKLKIPVYPAIGGVVGKASIMVNLPLIQANN